MQTNIKVIKSRVDPELTLCTIANANEVLSRLDLSREEDPLQVSIVHLDRPVSPHRHSNIAKECKQTQECWVVLSGCASVVVFDIDDSIITELSLKEFDVLTTFHGGHSLVPNDSVRIVEVKNGPYLGRGLERKEIHAS